MKNAEWKKVYEMMFNNTPKKNRATIEQITNIRSQAKTYALIYGN